MHSNKINIKNNETIKKKIVKTRGTLVMNGWSTNIGVITI